MKGSYRFHVTGPFAFVEELGATGRADVLPRRVVAVFLQIRAVEE